MTGRLAPGICVAALALVLRVWNLDAIPIAGDESGYLRWAEIVAHQKQWFISLLDGKQPLCYWLYAPLLLAEPDDPLLPARWLSALAGAGATFGIYALGLRLSGERAAVVASALYALFPYALLYDRLAYGEAFVNLAGVLIVYTSLAALQDRSRSWKPAAWLGLAMGLGYFAKASALLFWFFPLLAAAWFRAPRPLARLGVAYGLAILFPLLCSIAVPKAPTMATHSVVVHQTSFFVTPAELFRNPLLVAPRNLRLLGEYISAYCTIPLALAGAAGLGWLLYRRSGAAALVVSASILPLLVQVFLVEKFFPSRYPFPHFWPWLVVLGLAADRLPRPRALLLAGAALLLLAIQGVGVVRDPYGHLYIEDAQTFLGSGPAAGHGIREAAQYLRREAERGPITVLTDAVWGPPADAMFAYLNGRDGIRVHEAWWTQLSPDHPILPAAPVELMKSQYERVAAGFLDPRALDRVYYVTETFYNPPAAVRRRQPGAHRLISFIKPNGRNSIDIYRLK